LRTRRIHIERPSTIVAGATYVCSPSARRRNGHLRAVARLGIAQQRWALLVGELERVARIATRLAAKLLQPPRAAAMAMHAKWSFSYSSTSWCSAPASLLVLAVVRSLRAPPGLRVWIAAVVGGLAAFMAAAAVEWVWEMAAIAARSCFWGP